MADTANSPKSVSLSISSPLRAQTTSFCGKTKLGSPHGIKLRCAILSHREPGHAHCRESPLRRLRTSGQIRRRALVYAGERRGDTQSGWRRLGDSYVSERVVEYFDGKPDYEEIT